jgi:rubrerythrin
MDQDLFTVREILIRELETINTYQTMLERSQRPEVKDFINHIVQEEKEHVAEALDLIKNLDPEQARLLTIGHVERASKESNGRHFTVGSLRQ